MSETKPPCRGATMKTTPTGMRGPIWMVCNTCGAEICRFDPATPPKRKKKLKSEPHTLVEFPITARQWAEKEARKACQDHEFGRDAGAPK